MNIIVSECLLGINCRYDGKNNYSEKILELIKKHNVIPVCPECLGGLCTPRDPAEILNGKVITSKGIDVTKQYINGANEALKLAKMYGCKIAIFQQRSPSCGSGVVHDGCFSGKLIKGNGVTAKMFIDNGIRVITEDEIDSIL